MRLLVCGGRDYEDYDKVSQVLSALYWSLNHEEQNLFVLIHGCTRGLDRLADNWAVETGLDEDFHVWRFPADWGAYGKAAGPIRNQRMIDEGRPDLVIAFPGGRGTLDMVRRARLCGVEVREIAGTEHRG